MRWKQSPKQKKSSEEFVGTLRAELSAEAREFIRPMRPVKRDIKENGLIFEYFEDGHVTVTSVYDHIQKMVEEIKQFRQGKGRGF